MKKLVATLLLLVILLSVMQLNAAIANPSIPPDWQPIRIKSNGTISPSNSPIKILDENHYVLSNDLPARGSTFTFHNIVVEKDNIILDGSYHSIDGLGTAWGIDITSRRNVTIKNIEISKFSGGVIIYNSSGVIISDCSILSNAEGIRITNSTNTQILNNNLAENYHMALSIGHTNNTIVFGNNLPYNGRTDIFLREGINLAYSSNNYIIANNITKHSTGIYTLNSSNNYFYLNNIIDNQVQVQEALNEHDWSWLNGSISHEVFLYFSVNNWDNGSLGNCWSTYKGIDANKDGIGDKAYIVNDENSDKYPLTKEANNQTNSIDIDSLRQLVYQNILPTKKGVPDEPHLYYIIIFALIITVLLVSLSLVIITFKKKIK